MRVLHVNSAVKNGSAQNVRQRTCGRGTCVGALLRFYRQGIEHQTGYVLERNVPYDSSPGAEGETQCQHTKQLLPQKESCREPSSRSRNERKSQKVAATVTGKNRCRHAAGKPLAMEVGEEQERKVVALKKELRGEKKIEALISIHPDTEKCGM